MIAALVVAITVPSAYGFSQTAAHIVMDLEPGQSETAQWGLNSDLDETVTIFFSATLPGSELIIFEKEVVLNPDTWTNIDITVTIPEGYPHGYYEPLFHALLKGNSDNGIVFHSMMTKKIEITVIPNESEYKLDLQIGKGNTIRNVLGDLTFTNDKLVDFTATIYNQKGELTFGGNFTSASSEEDMIQNGAVILLKPTTDTATHDREFEMIFTPTENENVFDVSGTIYTLNLEDDAVFRSVPIQSGTLTLID